MAKVLLTGASGIAGQLVSSLLAEAGYDVRRADVSPPFEPTTPSQARLRSRGAVVAAPVGEFVRCDTRSFADVQAAVRGCDAVVHLAAWHIGHQPPISDATIFAVNVDGTFNLIQACREAGIESAVFASSMAYGWGAVYGTTKVIGEDLWRMYHEITGASVAMLRYHDFVPKPYLAWGEKLLRNGVDARDVATATVAAVTGALEHRFGLFMTIVHSDHHLPAEVRADFATHGPAWCEEQVPGSVALLQKYGIELPTQVEQHDLSEAARLTGWVPSHDFREFLTDLRRRDEAGDDVAELWAPGRLPDASSSPTK